MRRIGRGLLRGQHVAHLVVEGAGVLLRVEIAALPAPIGPSTGQTMKHLFGALFVGEFRLALGKDGESILVRHLTPEEGRDRVFLDAFQPRRDAGPAEIFLRHHVGSDLAPRVGDLDSLLPEDHRTVWIADFAGRGAERNALIGRFACGGEKTIYTHTIPP